MNKMNKYDKLNIFKISRNNQINSISGLNVRQKSGQQEVAEEKRLSELEKKIYEKRKTIDKVTSDQESSKKSAEHAAAETKRLNDLQRKINEKRKAFSKFATYLNPTNIKNMIHGERSISGGKKKLLGTFSSTFPFKFNSQKLWFWKYSLISFVVGAPVFYKLQKLVNSPEDKRAERS